MIFSNLTNPIDYFQDVGIPVRTMTEMLNEWNPSNDPTIDSFSLLILNLQRELCARSGRFQKGYWSKLPPEDQMIAEGEAMWLTESIRDAYVATRMYTLDKIEAVPADFDDADLLKAIGEATAYNRKQAHELNRLYEDYGHEKHVFTTKDMCHRIVEYGAVLSLIPGNLPLAHHEDMLLRTRPDEATDKFELYAVPNQQEAISLQRYRNILAPVKGEMMESLSCTLAELQVASITGNQEKSKKAAPPMILFDDDIPHPSRVSIGGWLQICSAAFRKLTQLEVARIRHWFGGRPEYIITYIPPFMPRTHEHMTGGQVTQNNSGDAGWSLSSRSKYHVRFDTGAIDYGIWMARTVVIGEDEDGDYKTVPVLLEGFDSMDISRIALHEHALDALGLESTIHDWVLGRFKHTVGVEQFKKSEATSLTTSLIHPGVGGGSQGLAALNLHDDPVIYPMASLADNWDIHLRFGDMAAFTSWCIAFEQMAWWYANSGRSQRMAGYMKDMIHRVHNVRNPGKFSHFNKAGVNTVFDLTGL